MPLRQIRIRVLHVLPDLRTGGGQAVVLLLVRNHDPALFDIRVAYLDRPSDMEEAFVHAGTAPVLLDRGRKSPIRVVSELTYLLRRESIDIVHVHSGPDRKYGHAAARLAGRPVVGHLHSPWNHRGKQAPPAASLLERTAGAVKGWGRDRIERRTVRAYIAAGEAVRRFHDPLTDVPIHCIPNGIDVASLARAGDSCGGPGRSEEMPVLICVGRLSAGKGQDRLIAMLPSLAGELVLVGGGDMRDDLERMAVDLGVRDRVRFLGEREDVSALLAEADVFVLASVSEGLPLAVLEAMASGTPVVAFDLPGLRDVIDHGSSGFLIPQGDTEAFGLAVRRLLEDPQLAQQVGVAGRAVVASRFDARVMTRGVEAVYLDVMSSPNRSYSGKKGS